MILAGLRLIQSEIVATRGVIDDEDIDRIATNDGSHDTLTADEIDGLCERLNFVGAEDGPLPSAEDVKNDPATSRWLSAGLATALSRDPVDAVNDAELLHKLLQARLDNLVGGAKR